MKNEIKKLPDVQFKSEYFVCPKCGWMKGPVRVKGDIAHVPCEKCGHSYLVRKK